MNYKLIGGDQKEYGPVSAEQMRQWLAEGRVTSQTLVQAEGETGWRPLSDYTELAPTPVAPAPFAAVASQASLPEGDATAAAAALKVPAIMLIIAGSLGVVGALFSIVQHVFGLAMAPVTLPPDVPPQVAQFVKAMQTMGIPMALLSLGLNGVILFGGLSMLKVQRWGFAMAACIIGLACGNPCCCPVGLVAGIWGLIQLCKADVKSSFR